MGGAVRILPRTGVESALLRGVIVTWGSRKRLLSTRKDEFLSSALCEAISPVSRSKEIAPSQRSAPAQELLVWSATSLDVALHMAAGSFCLTNIPRRGLGVSQ